MTNYDASINYDAPINYDGGADTSLIGGHFLPKGGKKRHTLSNVLVVYNQAKDLPRKETKELRDIISEFVPPDVAMIAAVPDIAEINYEALEANANAYEKFIQALMNIQERLEIFEIKEQEDNELMEFAIIASLIH